MTDSEKLLRIEITKEITEDLVKTYIVVRRDVIKAYGAAAVFLILALFGANWIIAAQRGAKAAEDWAAQQGTTQKLETAMNSAQTYAANAYRSMIAAQGDETAAREIVDRMNKTNMGQTINDLANQLSHDETTFVRWTDPLKIASRDPEKGVHGIVIDIEKVESPPDVRHINARPSTDVGTSHGQTWELDHP